MVMKGPSRRPAKETPIKTKAQKPTVPHHLLRQASLHDCWESQPAGLTRRQVPRCSGIARVQQGPQKPQPGRHIIGTLLFYIFFLAGWLSRNIFEINIFVWSIVHRSRHRCARRYWLAQPIGELRANFHQWESSESLSGRHTSVMQLAKEKKRYQSRFFNNTMGKTDGVGCWLNGSHFS